MMDRPPGGWNDLVTNQVLEARLSALSSELRADVRDAIGRQTWRLATALLVTVTIMTAILRVT